MSVSFSILERIIMRPDWLDIGECDRLYDVDGYRVCILVRKRLYVVWDKFSEELDLEALLALEQSLADLMTKEGLTEEEILESIPPNARHFFERIYYGYGTTEPMMKDHDVIDVHVVVDKPVQVVHRRYGKLRTNIVLNMEEAEALVTRLAAKAGISISEAKPLASFIDPEEGARITVVYNSDVTLRKSMTVDIRKQPKKPWTILKLIDLGTVTPEEAAYLWLLIKYKVAIMVVGELMSGKTVLSNAILNLVPPDSRVMTIEDAPELRLYTDYWTRTTTRDSKRYPVTVFDLLKVAMRITPDYIVVGEVRGEEARQWAQAILLGHGGVTTFHAETPEAALTRLRIPPIQVDPQALRLLNVFVKMIPLRSESGELRRKAEVYIHEDGRIHRVFGFHPETGEIRREVSDPLGFGFFRRVELAHGVTRDELRREYRAMVAILAKAYEEAKEHDPELEKPDYKELPALLYRALSKVIKREKA